MFVFSLCEILRVSITPIYKYIHLQGPRFSWMSMVMMYSSNHWYWYWWCIRQIIDSDIWLSRLVLRYYHHYFMFCKIILMISLIKVIKHQLIFLFLVPFVTLRVLKVHLIHINTACCTSKVYSREQLINFNTKFTCGW